LIRSQSAISKRIRSLSHWMRLGGVTIVSYRV
jgi:hypothetical protein